MKNMLEKIEQRRKEKNKKGCINTIAIKKNLNKWKVKEKIAKKNPEQLKGK